MPFTAGTNVGPYRIMEQLGQGGMATVYKAYHASLDRYVAIKVLHQAFLEDSSFQARFLREARLVAKLEHPNIVPIYDYAEHEGQPYLVMKYIEGETLKARLARGMLTADEVSKMVDSVGTALAYAHKQGILHRDIKPSNVIIAGDGQIYLADFGLARIAQAGESTLTSDMILGTPQYISPEQALGKKELDAGTDIYSFGVMIYEMVVGRVPFSADTPFSIIHDHIYTPLPLPRAINPNVPEDIERILLKCLAKERADRYEDVKSLVDVFQSAWTVSGVIGHAATLAMPVRPEVPISDKAPTLTPGKPPSDKTAPAAAALKIQLETAEIPAQKARRKRSPWLLAALLVLLVSCCVVISFAISNRGREAARYFAPTEVASMQTALVSEMQTSIAEDGIGGSTPAEVTPKPPELPPKVAEALGRAEARPNDAYVRLELALAYNDAGMDRKYMEELAKAGELAGDNQGFFLDAGRQLTARQAWIGASAMYLRAAALQPPGKPLPKEIQNLLEESIYKASKQPEFPASIPFERIAGYDQPLSMIAQSRHAYYNGDKPKAHSLLKDVKRIKPGLQTAMLLEAEYNFNEGRVDEARTLLNLLTADLGTLEWVRIEAEVISKQLP